MSDELIVLWIAETLFSHCGAEVLCTTCGGALCFVKDRSTALVELSERTVFRTKIFPAVDAPKPWLD
jgi:hypothetical protein